MTVQLDDRYVICPPIQNWGRGHLDGAGARPVEEGFRYSSDSNAEWLDGNALMGLIGRKAA